MRRWPIAAALLLVSAAPGGKSILDLDLSRPFGLPAGWRLTATQKPDVEDVTGEPEAGAVIFCLRQPGGDCDRALDGWLRAPNVPDYGFNDPHFIDRAAIVRPRGPSAAPLLIVRGASLHGGNGDQVIVTQVLARRGSGFVRVFRDETGRNNNQEVRLLERGPLRGDIIAVHPTQDAPFAYWITISRLTPATTYRQTARFRSATRYGDDNPLAVIDSEMPNIKRRLGLWRPGRPLPLPAGPCPRPRLEKGALWCK